uniref:Uncharacterized protein n=1 Tax=Trichogramma kaykai TaxID=54128 RepID=A0ABD2WZF0_9HYME
MEAKVKSLPSEIEQILLATVHLIKVKSFVLMQLLILDYYFQLQIFVEHLLPYQLKELECTGLRIIRQQGVVNVGRIRVRQDFS